MFSSGSDAAIVFVVIVHSEVSFFTGLRLFSYLLLFSIVDFCICSFIDLCTHLSKYLFVACAHARVCVCVFVHLHYLKSYPRGTFICNFSSSFVARCNEDEGETEVVLFF